MQSFPRLAAACGLAIAIAVAMGRTGAAQAPQIWAFEDVGTANLSNCVRGSTLAGFELDPQGRPVLAWREENGCGGGPRVFWTRKDNGDWHQAEFLSARRYLQ